MYWTAASPGPLWPGSQADIDSLLKQLFGLGPDDRDAIGAAIELHYAATLLYDVEPPNAAYAPAIAGLEHLSRAYGAAPVEWPDWKHADRLDKVFLDLALTSEQSERLRAELLPARHLRLRQTFANYVVNGLPDDYWQTQLEDFVPGLSVQPDRAPIARSPVDAAAAAPLNPSRLHSHAAVSNRNFAAAPYHRAARIWKVTIRVPVQTSLQEFTTNRQSAQTGLPLRHQSHKGT